MPTIFTPWRYAYIKNGTTGDCIFCHAESKKEICEDLLVLKLSTHALIMMNRYPYTNGHLMVAPRRHTAELEELSKEELTDIMSLVLDCKKCLKEVYSPQGFNIGMNLGLVAGAGIEDHLHVHIVPRWNGDHNFMRVLADTRMIPEDLSTTYSKLLEKINL